MRTLTTTTAPEQFLGAYGERPRFGVITEHLDMFVRAGGEVRPGTRTAGWVVIDRKAYPIMCSELVWVYTEDGRVTGRCGGHALAETGTCDAHDPR